MILPPHQQSIGQDAGAPTASTGRQNKRLVIRPYLGKSHEITIYEGGQLVHIRGQSQKSKVTYPKGKPRGAVKDFSAKSRQRLMRKIAMIDVRAAGLPVFLTLTYPGEYTSDCRQWKTDLHNFRRELVRKYPEVWGLWRLEFQKRGAPHYHGMLWGLPKIQGTEHMRDGKVCWRVLPGISCKSDLEVFNWLSNTWFRIVGSDDEKHLHAGVNLEPVQSWNGVVSYVSKYLGKNDDGEFVPKGYSGRFWGVMQAKKWKMTKFEAGMTEEAFHKMRRVIRKCQERAQKLAVKQAREVGRRIPAWARKARQRGPGIHWLMDSAVSMRILAWAVAECQQVEDCPF